MSNHITLHKRGRDAAAEGRLRFPVGTRVRIMSAGWRIDPVGTVVGHTTYKFRVKLDTLPMPMVCYATNLTPIGPALLPEGAAPSRQLQKVYSVELGSWDSMCASLLLQLLPDAGSVRKLAKAIGVPRSTLSAWIRKAREDQ